MEITNELLRIAIDAARSAGVVIMEEYGSPDFEKKSDGSPVTQADSRAHEILMTVLGEAQLPILSEESEVFEFPYPEKFWIIDPVDGTRDFLSKTGNFATMIALIENGRPSLGVVYAPAQQKLYFAEKGRGAFLEVDGKTRTLQVENRTANLRCIGSVHHVDERSLAVTTALKAEVIPMGCVGIKTGLISEQKGDFAFYFGKLGEWDVAGPEIILTEAGGSATDIDGSPLFYGNREHRIQKGVAFSNGTCHERLLTAMRSVQ